MRGLILRYAETCRKHKHQLKAVEDLLTRTERERSVAAEGEVKAKEELARQKGRMASQLKDLDEALQKERALSAQAACNLDFSESERRLAVSRSLAHEERAKAALDRAAAAEAKAKAAEAKATAAEEAAAEAERRAARAVEEYKDSDAFATDAAKASVNVYSIGFYDCRSRVAEEYPDLNLVQVVVPGDPVEGEEESGGDDDDDDDDDVVEVAPLAAPPTPGSGTVVGPSTDPVVASVPPEASDVQAGGEAAPEE